MDDLSDEIKPVSNERSLLPGIALILAGGVFLAANVMDISLSNIWPGAILAVSLVFYFMVYRDRSKFGLLMPATVLFVVACIFMTCEWYGWTMMNHLWPLFIMGPGMGFFMLYYFGNKDRGLLIPGGILTGLGVIFLFQQFGHARLWPVILILLGLVLVLTRKSGEGDS